MKIKQKFAVLVAIPVLAMVAVTGLGWWSLSDMTEDMNVLVDDHFLTLVDGEVTPLINDEMMPLINEDVVRIRKLEHSIRLMLEADRDVHQAVIAEKQSLVASNEEGAAAADKANLENVDQAESRLARASEQFTTDAAKEVYGKFLESFATWKEKTRRVIEMATIPEKLQFARKASNGGSAQRAFDEMRDFIDQLQEIQGEQIDIELAKVDEKKAKIWGQKEHMEKSKERVVAIAREDESHASAAAKMFVSIGVIACIVVPIFGFFTARSVAVPIGKTVEMLQDIAEGGGDLTKQLDAKSKDELGDLARAFNKFVGKLRGIIQQIAGNAQTLAGSATELSSTAAELASGAEETTNQSASVSAAAEQMSANMGNMAFSSEQMSSNVKTVSAAVEEMTASINEVAKNAEQAAQVAQQAAGLAQTSNDNIGQLGEAADAIGKVVETIQDIAEQTNLLALNATIEAARAGEAGKGFAVVATEVKELAKQTAEATEDIRKRIDGIQSSTGVAVTSIGEISKVIDQVNDVSRTIATSVKEQSVTTSEIAESVAQTANAASVVSTGVNESASASAEITRNITGVDNAARQAAMGASQTQTAGEELSRLGEQLQSLVGQFKT